MPDLPTLHLTNWSSRKLHGPGHKYTIMAAPRAWEHGDGVVSLLVPALGLVRSAQSGTLSMEEYRASYEQTMGGVGQFFLPGRLLARTPAGIATVADGDTLCCACSVAEARAGRCHRTWAAQFLVRAGWRVILDGTEVPPCV